MHALVITTLEPLGKDTKIWGTYWRYRLFLEAICEIARVADVLHLVADDYVKQNLDTEILSAEQSAYLGLPVSTHLVPCQPPRTQTFVNHYLKGIASIYEQSDYFWYAGAKQVERVQAFIDQRPDLVFVHRLRAMLPLLRCNRKPSRVFFDLDDIVHRVRLQAALRPPMRPGELGALCQIPAMALAERRGAAISRRTFVCSELDRVRVNRLGFPRVDVLPNAVPIPTEPPALPREPTILLLASWIYPPNLQAVERLVLRVFPRIRTGFPEARVLVAGQGSLDLPARLGQTERVEYLGYVEDLASLYASARIICCPITSGSGTRLKLIEAAAYARPVVATRFAAEGLSFRNGVEILLHDDDAAIAEQCVRLLRDDVLCRAIGDAARRQVKREYDPAAIRGKVVGAMLQSLAGT